MSYSQLDSDLWRMSLSEKHQAPLAFLPEPEFDSAVVGVAQEGFVIYDAIKVVQVVSATMNYGREAAHAYAEMNIFNGEEFDYPVFFWPVDPPILNQQ